MTGPQMVITISVVMALASAWLAWLAWPVIDVGSGTLKRYRANFAERTQFQMREFFLFIDPRQLFAVNVAGC